MSNCKTATISAEVARRMFDKLFTDSPKGTVKWPMDPMFALYIAAKYPDQQEEILTRLGVEPLAGIDIQPEAKRKQVAESAVELAGVTGEYFDKMVESILGPAFDKEVSK